MFFPNPMRFRSILQVRLYRKLIVYAGEAMVSVITFQRFTRFLNFLSRHFALVLLSFTRQVVLPEKQKLVLIKIGL